MTPSWFDSIWKIQVSTGSRLVGLKLVFLCSVEGGFLRGRRQRGSREPPSPHLPCCQSSNLVALQEHRPERCQGVEQMSYRSLLCTAVGPMAVLLWSQEASSLSQVGSPQPASENVVGSSAP